ncbi:MAG: PIN domain-containing protein [Deltaproteobacteria bacterium]|nr:PIN domain-containing protein [Deltaproteobacteria bacterium]
MSGSYFVDTNVLVYARDASEPQKQELAEQWLTFLWESRNGRLSIQVLNEYYATVTQKLDPGLRPALARKDVRDLMAWQPISLDTQTLENAWTVQDRFKLSWWDSLIVSAAQISGCKYLLTEDIQNQQDLYGLQVVNPFKENPPRK